MEVHVHAPSRLHFGMFSFHQPGVRRFGGVGAMIDQPGASLLIQPAATFSAVGPLAERVEGFVRLAAKAWEMSNLPCRIEVKAAPAQHVGLGTGTQLAMSVVAGLAKFFDRRIDSPEAAAQLAGRGRRSAIGLNGFFDGGLLVEAGKFRDDEISPLVARSDVPDTWRWVLVRRQDIAGLAGAAEQHAFAELLPVPVEVTGALCREALLGLMPAAVNADFEAFSESLFRYGKMAGECFASQQEGAFVTPSMLGVLQRIRELGVQGVGQTSWGPTLFAITRDDTAACKLADELRADQSGDLEITIARPCNSGARIEVIP